MNGKDTNNTTDVVYEYDSAFKFSEPDIVKCDDLTFYPAYFLRAHSKNNDPTDLQTQIWQCQFEPDPQDSTKYTDIVATCGGTSVCFISVKTGEVILKYNKNSKSGFTENLYALSWSSLPLDEVGLKRMNILAVSGGKSTVILIHPEAGCCYQMFKTVRHKSTIVVCSLYFHPKKASWLFCGHDDGHIQLWDVGIPSLPQYAVTPVHLLKIPPVRGGDVYNLLYSQERDLLIAGCESGLYAWHFELDKVEKDLKLQSYEFELSVPEVEDSGTVVDSICLVRDHVVAIKCALHGFIYLFNLDSALKTAATKKTSTKRSSELLTIELKMDSLLRLKWSDTDNYYMNMGVDPESCTLVCGDDKGILWIYELSSYINGELESPLNGGPMIDALECDFQLEWPELDDPEVEKARKVRLDANDIVVDKCTVSAGAQYIVAVTSNNMVCVWKRGVEPEGED